MKRGAVYSGRLPQATNPASTTPAGGVLGGRYGPGAQAQTARAAGSRPRGEERGPKPTAQDPGPPGRLARLRSLAGRHRTGLAFLLGALLTLLVLLADEARRESPFKLTQDDIDAAVLHTLENRTLPSRSIRAAMAVAGSVVRVEALSTDEEEPEAGLKERGVGTAVVVMEDGTMLTNLHVVAGAEQLKVTFFDGTESPARIVGTQPDNDLAILKPQKIPDDLAPATLGSSRGLLPGDDVVVVGFPFGIGPSVSAGVVSGLNRQFRSKEGKSTLKGLIQFDAAANPGNSGGPLVNASGEVVGIVTAILNPTEARTFIGIGFAVTIEDAGGALGIPPF
jgi:S1-C subfamily serine protease